MAIKTVIVDDDLTTIELLADVIDEIYDVEIIETFSRGEDLFKVVKELNFELCIIDFHLKGMSGIQCAQKLKDKKIILTSREIIPADEAMDIEDVVDVLKITKPIQVDRVARAIKKVRDDIMNERGFVILKTYPDNIQQISIDDIIYITPDNNDSRVKIIHTKSDIIRTQKYTNKRLMEKLPDNKFCQISKSEIINIDYFHSYNESDSIILKNPLNIKKEIELTISGAFHKAFTEKIGIDDI